MCVNIEISEGLSGARAMHPELLKAILVTYSLKKKLE
jgi:hypothetical protein